ncbi:hypothetical protein SAMN04487895_101523 [Paenibacillus sophorae]|uniref:Uncharacterized protein n=1 Tax=Paenibacillus sophorae TaxID=1333845 RepID=A0A1H8GJG2_9BACL|nr:hypothetical protein [Paenibacillus sophorae]QWU14233.1 hypothetical protein KP014_20190 [Paenibacillus sophorae]SEN43627.1 hypothetical protein SAMN04487895_101523 [Paenibacillus sophorae]
MKIIGMKIEKYIGQTVSGHNCDFEYTDVELERHIIFGILSDNRKVKIKLWEEEGECGSGWCAASWGRIEIEEVERFDGYTFKLKAPITVPDLLPEKDYDDVENDVFSVYYDGGDGYYPNGGYSVDMDLFIQTIRHKDKRPVWVFKGSSNRGKSYIAAHINGLEVYETDSQETLPDSITSDVIVLGNKNTYTIDELEPKIFGNYELHIVDFG